MKTKPTNAVVREAIKLALSRAQQVSGRAGISWALIDGLEDIVQYDAAIAGLDKHKIVAAVQAYGDTLDHLFISMEPNTTACDVADLLRAINNSQCNHITIGHRFADSVADPHWRQWERSWAGDIHYLSANATSMQLSAGITSIKERRRPWITAISAACFEGVNLPLGTFLKTFDFLPYLNNLLQQQRALFYAGPQAHLLPYLSARNFSHELLDTFEIFNASDLNSILQYCALQERCSAVVLCDMPLLEFLIEKNLVDEVVHHIGETGTENSVHHERRSKGAMEALFDSTRWMLVANSALGNCNRIILRKQLSTHKASNPELTPN